MQSRLVTTAVVFLGVTAVCLQHAGPARAEVNVTRMKQALSEHFSRPRHHVSNPGYKQAAMGFLRHQFRQMGLQAHLHLFPTALHNVTGINVIGLLKGRHFNTDKDSIVAIGAHYDTMRNTPGVDDNGAAVVVMLEAAWQLSQNPDRDHTMLFIAFDFEEWEVPNLSQVACQQISCGSRALVEHWLPNFFPQPLLWKGIFVMDTIMNFNHTTASQSFPAGVETVFPEQAEDIKKDGGRGDFLTIAGRPEDKSLLDLFHQQWSAQSQSQYEIEQFTVPQINLAFDSFLRSDHVSFWLQQLNAIFITDTADFRGYMRKCYHHSCDTLDKVTPQMMQFAAKTCRTLISVLDQLSSATSASTSQHQQLWKSPVLGSLLLLTVVNVWPVL